MKKDIEFLTNRCIEISFNENSPLVRWLHLGANNKTELAIFNLAYCWRYILNHDLQDSDEYNVKWYIYTSFLAVKEKKPNLEFVAYFEIFLDRHAKLREEIFCKRNNIRYFPLYYYGRICNSPLEMSEISSFDFSNLWQSELDLSDQFAHQLNFLEDELGSIL